MMAFSQARAAAARLPERNAALPYSDQTIACRGEIRTSFSYLEKALANSCAIRSWRASSSCC